jgi:hypothetical protein
MLSAYGPARRYGVQGFFICLAHRCDSAADAASSVAHKTITFDDSLDDI